MTRTRSCVAVPACALALALAATSARAQDPGGPARTEQVTYANERDSTQLTASLALPEGDGPHAAIVLLSIAGTGPIVDRLTAEGYVVLMPVRRGFVDVEPLLRATYADLAGDAQAALAYLKARPEVDPQAIGVVAQADDAAPAMMANVEAGVSVPLVLLAPPAFPGVEAFRREQEALAARDRASPAEIDALDEYVAQIADIVVSDATPTVREYRLRSLRVGSRVELPRSAAYPADELQMHFFASPLWHDRLAFDPEAALARIRSPLLVLIGVEDADTPIDAYLAAVGRGLAAEDNVDSTVCLLPGRTRHTFSAEGVTAIAEWLTGRVGHSDGDWEPGSPSGCIEDEGR